MKMNKSQKKIMDALNNDERELSVRQISNATGLSLGAVYYNIERLMWEKKVKHRIVMEEGYWRKRWRPARRRRKKKDPLSVASCVRGGYPSGV